MLHYDEQSSFEHYKVKVWLDSQPTSTPMAIESATEPEVGSLALPSHKRKRDDSDHTQAADCRRRPLLENSMNSPPAKHAELDPPKRMTRGMVDGTPAETGYSKALQSKEITILPRKGTKSNSSIQSRSTSPVKTIHDLTMADPPITFSEANSKTIQPPAAGYQLYKKILDVSDGFNLLPESLKDGIITYCKYFETRIPRDEYFKKSSDPLRKPTQEELHTWDAVKRIRENATRCSEDGDSEAGWGEKVYSQILDVALGHSPYKHAIGWKNITTARIEPKFLVPRHLSGKLFESKMVDYAMILLPDHKMHQAILQVLSNLPEEDQNINQTRFAPVKYRPITVNIEVKLPGEGKNDMMIQLAVWTAAQLKKLNVLSGTLAPIGIPFVSVEGHDWRLYNTFQTDDGKVVRQSVWGNDLFGDSSSTLGIYKVIAAIQVLAEWSDTEYRAWFEEEVLKLLAEV